MTTTDTREASLIDAVRQRRCLYDKTYSEYRVPSARQEAWEQVASVVGMEVENVKQMWFTLRNCFTNVIRRRMKKPSNEFKKWKYEDKMLFLAPYMDTVTGQLFVLGDKVQFLDGEAAISETSRHASESSDSDFEQKFVIAEEHSRSSENVDAKKSTEQGSKHEKRGSKVIESVYDYFSEFDAEELFYLSMAKVTKTLPKTEQSKLRIEVSKIISEAEMQSDESDF